MFNDERRKNASFVFEKMKRYYPNFETPDEFAIGEWVGILDGYSQTDILESLKNYRKNVPYNVAPTPAAFKGFLHKTETTEQPTVAQAACGDWAWEQMNHDISTGDCKANLYMYRAAEDLIINDWLSAEIPTSEWAAMNRIERVAVAKARGLFSRYDAALQQVCQRRFHRDYEFLSENEQKAAKSGGNYQTPNIDAVKVLAAHWKIGA